MTSTLPERLEEVMSDLQMKEQKELAEFCGVTEGLVTQWFQGTTRLGPKPLKAFGRKTNYSLDWLTEGRLPKRRGEEPVILEMRDGIDYDSIRRMVEPILKEHGLEFSDLVTDEQSARARVSAKLGEQKIAGSHAGKLFPTQVKWTRNKKNSSRQKAANEK